MTTPATKVGQVAGHRLTRAQREMLHTLSDGREWDRRDVLSKAQWNTIGWLHDAGLVRQTVFHAQITPAGLAALDDALLSDGNAWYTKDQRREIAKSGESA